MADILLEQQEIPDWTFTGVVTGSVNGTTTDVNFSASNFGLIIARPYIVPVDLTGQGITSFTYEFDIVTGTGAATLAIEIAAYTTPYTYYRQFVISSTPGHYSLDLSEADPVPGAEGDAGIWDVGDFLQALIQTGGNPNGSINVYAYLVMTNPGQSVSITNFSLVAHTSDFIATPILRVYPRSDGLGASTTPNVIGPRSQQRSNRAAGGTYY